MKKYLIGVDVGGTNVKLGIITADGHIVSKKTFPTKKHNQKVDSLIKAFNQSIHDLVTEESLQLEHCGGIGIGLPGLVDPDQGVVKFLPNIPGWRDIPLKQRMEKALGRPVFLENDVNLIALGEWKFGAGRGYKNLICLTLGTGVGSGLILNDQLYRGEGYAAGELGHIPLNEDGPPCNCGGWGCLERYVGNKYLLEKAAKIFSDPEISLEDVYQLAKEGDQRALGFWEDAAGHIGNGLTGLVNLLNPSLIIIGGGVSQNHRFLFQPIRKVIKKRAMNVQGRMFKLVKASLGADAPILGAQVLINEQLNES